MEKKEDAQSSASAGETPANILANPGFLQTVQQRLDAMGEGAGGFFGEGYVIISDFFFNIYQQRKRREVDPKQVPPLSFLRRKSNVIRI